MEPYLEGYFTNIVHTFRWMLSFLQLSDKQREDLEELYRQTGAKRAVEARLLNFLSYNYYHMPMYAKPGMVWFWAQVQLTFCENLNCHLFFKLYKISMFQAQ